MDLSDSEAHADYWNRQVELNPDDFDVLAMRVLAVADFVIHVAVMDYFNEPGS